MGIILQFTTTYTHEQIGKNERSNRTILNAVRSILYDSQLPEEYWEFAASFWVYTSNRTWSKSLGHTPYKEWFEKQPDLSELRIFGSICYVYNSTKSSSQYKLLPRAWKGIFVGYRGSGYRIWDPVSKKLTVSNHVKVIESERASDWLKELSLSI